MAISALPAEERALTPDQVENLDRRRRRGQLLIVIGFQMLIVACLTLLWSGQDLQYSPGWAHPMVYWNCVTFLGSMTCFAVGLNLRRGLNEFFSY